MTFVVASSWQASSPYQFEIDKHRIGKVMTTALKGAYIHSMFGEKSGAFFLNESREEHLLKLFFLPCTTKYGRIIR